jgi:hypothetical protein
MSFLARTAVHTVTMPLEKTDSMFHHAWHARVIANASMFQRNMHVYVGLGECTRNACAANMGDG